MGVASIIINLVFVITIRLVVARQGLDQLDDMRDLERTPDEEGASAAASNGSFTKVSADIWFSTGALISALAFLRTVEVFFRVDPTLDRFTDVAMLYIFSLVAVGVAGVVLALLQKADAEDAEKVGARQPISVGLYVRKFISKMFTMCAATIVYLLIYVSVVELQFKIQRGDETQSVYDPLPVWSAAILLGSSMIINLTVGLFIERSLKATAAALAAVDRERIPGVIDDAILATLQSVAQTTATSYMAAFTWLVGAAMHKFFSSAWAVYFAAPTTERPAIGHVDWVMSVTGYAVVVTVLAVITSACLPPPPKEV